MWVEGKDIYFTTSPASCSISLTPFSCSSLVSKVESAGRLQLVKRVDEGTAVGRRGGLGNFGRRKRILQITSFSEPQVQHDQRMLQLLESNLMHVSTIKKLIVLPLTSHLNVSPLKREQNKVFIFSVYFVLEYSCLTMLC